MQYINLMLKDGRNFNRCSVLNDNFDSQFTTDMAKRLLDKKNANFIIIDSKTELFVNLRTDDILSYELV